MNFKVRATVITYLMASCVLVSLHPSGPLLSQCTQSDSGTDRIDLACTVGSGQFLDYNDIRAFTRARPDTKKFNVGIDCSGGGVIHLPWPFSAINVVSLQVSGCETVGYISEMFDQYPHSNELKNVLLADVKHMITIKELYETFQSHDAVPKDFDCGLKGAVVQVFKNTQYKFPPPTGSVEEMIMLEELMSKNTLEKLLSHNSICRYPYLQYLEESGNTALSSLRFKLMEATSLYPELRYYVLKNNTLPSVPVEFRNLAAGFLPKLEILDLSRNDIRNLDFAFNVQRDAIKPLLINLQNNKIQVLRKILVDSLIQKRNVILDVRRNPLVCTCDLYKYAEFLLSLPVNYEATDLANFSCTYEQGMKREVHHISEPSLRTALCNF